MKQRKYAYFMLLSILISLFSGSVAYSCEYWWQIAECYAANKSWTTKAIDDFVCIVWTYEEITYQVIIDWEFKLLDEEMDIYLEDLEYNKNYYFWKDRVKTFIEWLNDIESKKKYFRQKYNVTCWKSILEKATACLTWEETSITNARRYFKTTDCSALVEKKLEIFDDVAYAILLLNKKQIRTDEKRIYDQWERANYDLLVDLMRVNLSYLGRLAKKWNTKLQNTY